MAAAGIQMASATDITVAKISPAVVNAAARPAITNSLLNRYLAAVSPAAGNNLLR